MICMILSGVTVSCAMSSCSNDDDDVNNNMSSSRWVLVKCSAHYTINNGGGGSISADWDKEFTYDSNGRITSDTDDDYTYKYEGNNIVTDDGGVFTLGKNGFITSFKVDGDDGIAEYNSNGNIIKYNSGDSWIADLKWNNGLLTRANVSYPSTTKSFDIEYYNSDVINADCSAALNAQFVCWDLFDGYWALGMCGFWGKMPNKPMKKITSTRANSSSPSSLFTYEDIDANGCPGKLSIKDSWGKHTYNLVWEKL